MSNDTITDIIMKKKYIGRLLISISKDRTKKNAGVAETLKMIQNRICKRH